MGERTKIEWADATFNPWTGCTKVSPACDNCYAEAWAKRSGTVEWGPGKPRRQTTAAYWSQLRKWDAKAKAEGRRWRVFGGSLCDPFDAEVEDAWRDDYMAEIATCDGLDFLLLTKRPKVAADYFRAARLDPPANVWLGTTVETQKMADLRIPYLLEVPAKVRFLSIEPMLGPVDIAWALSPDRLEIAAGFLARGSFSPGLETLRPLAWVIAGGESGAHARPSHPYWFRSLRDQCAAAGVPFLFKQWGEWTPGENVDRRRGVVETAKLFDGEWMFERENLANEDGHIDDQPDLYRVGKKHAGRLLDGVQHDGVPG